MSTETKTRVAWQWCCQQPSFSSKQLQQAAEMTKRYSDVVIADWVKTGVVERISGSQRPVIYRVVDPQSPPKVGRGSMRQSSYVRRRMWRKTQQQKMWNTMLINRSFGLADLMLTCDSQLSKSYTYVERLVRAGYVKVLHRRGNHLPFNERELSHYQLVRDTGRLAPIIRPNGCWDQNEQRLYPFLTEESDHGRVA